MHMPRTHSPDDATTPAWSRQYEIRAVALLSAGSGLVGLDRFIINPLFPVIAKDLSLNYQDLGLISAVLALSWGLSSVFAGSLSDRIGRKRVLLPAVLVFSLLVATSGLAAGLISLLVIRALMGLAEGAYVPAGIMAATQASKPSRVGLNIGLQMMASPLVGLGLGPLIAVALLGVLPSWRWVFAVVALPGLLLTWLLYRLLRDDTPAPATAGRAPAMPLREVFRHRVVWVNTFCMVCWLSCLVSLSAFMPSYLTDHLQVGLTDMGLVLAGLGVGSFIGMVAVPALADRLGSRWVLLAATASVLPVLWHLPRAGAAPLPLFAMLAFIMFMIAGAVSVTVGPLTSGSIPARIATTATGVVIGIGEVVGGAATPAFTGWLAQRLGITVVPTVAFWAVAAGAVTVLLFVRPRRPAAA